MTWIDRGLLITVAAVHIAALLWVAGQLGLVARYAIDKLFEVEQPMPVSDGAIDLVDRLHDIKIDLKLGRVDVARDRVDGILFEMEAA